LLSLAAAARGFRLPAVRRGAVAAGSAAGASLAGAALVAGGVAFAALVNAVCLPAAAEVVAVAPGAPGTGLTALSTASGVWAAVGLGLPLLVLVIVATAAAVWRSNSFPEPGASSPRPAPLFEVPWTDWPQRISDRALALRLPEQYASLFDPRALEAAMARGQPVLWAVLLLVLAVAVNR
jgi:hypothetical protein